MIQTPISYYGGKQRMLQHILPRIRSHNNYTEVFFGGGAVFFAKPAVELETINDINNSVVNFYEVLQRDFDKLKPMVNASLASRGQLQRALDYYRDETAGKIERAWGFWISTNLAFSNKITGGLKWSNKPGNSVPSMLQNKKDKFTTLLQKRIENAVIENKDALEVLLSRDTPITLHYIDPPYINCHQGHYGGYGLQDYTNLLEVLTTLKGGWILSCFPSQILEEFATKHNWFIKGFDMNSSARRIEKHPRKTELLVSNYDMDHHLQTSIFNHEVLTA